MTIKDKTASIPEESKSTDMEMVDASVPAIRHKCLTCDKTYSPSDGCCLYCKNQAELNASLAADQAKVTSKGNYICYSFDGSPVVVWRGYWQPFTLHYMWRQKRRTNNKLLLWQIKSSIKMKKRKFNTGE